MTFFVFETINRHFLTQSVNDFKVYAHRIIIVVDVAIDFVVAHRFLLIVVSFDRLNDFVFDNLFRVHLFFHYVVC